MANITLKQFKNNEKLKVSEVYYDTTHSVLDVIFPIGRGFIDFTNTDYSNYLGFTWERELVGMVGVGLDASQTEFDTIGKTGGEKTHKLTINEMPSHQHDLEVHATGDTSLPIGGVANTSNAHASSKISENGWKPLPTGGDQPHNNLQPYKVVAYWKRVA